MKFILTADWHLRKDKPLCRLDEDWVQTQKNHVERVVKLAKDKNLPIVNVGDIFDTPSQPPEIEQIIPRILEQYDVKMYVLAGNHDLRYNSTEYLTKCSIGTLLCAKNVYTLEDTDTIHFEHRLVFKDKKDIPPNAKACTAQELLEENPSFTYVFTGDMHHKFLYKNNNRFVVNPGCLNIQVSNMQDYETGVWCADTVLNSFEWIALPDDTSLVSQKHNLIKKAKNERISSFIEQIQSGEQNTIDFWEIINHKLEKANDAEITNIIYKIKEKVC